MIRVLIYFLLLFALAAGFAWMSDLPGTISITWNGYVWEQPPVVVALVAGVALVAFLAAVWLIRVILKSPQIATRFFRRRRKDKGYTALSHGLIALGTGNAKLARRYGLDADRLLADEPAAKLLLAQTAQLAGKDDEARQRFEAMLQDPETKALGLHGLFVEAERHKEPVAARHYAEEAAKTAPGLEWAGKAVLGYQAVAHHWDESLKTLERNYAAKLLDKKTYRRQRAVILTALALKLEDGEPERAYSLAKEAHGLALDLVPAAVVTSRLATRKGDIRKASKVLEATWRLSPHPELAETYAHVRTGDSAVDRLKRVKSLAAQRANTPEGALAVARAAMEAREFDEARSQLKKLLQSEPTRNAYLLMAELEEAEHGDKGRMRDWLARAIKAPQDKAWIADGIVSAEWQAVSPVTGRLDAFHWAAPIGMSEDEGELLEDSLFDAPVLPAATPVQNTVMEKSEPQEDANTVDLTAEPVSKKAETVTAEAKKPEAEVVQPKETVSPSVNIKQGYEGTTDDVKFAPALKDLPDDSVPSTAKAQAEKPEQEETSTASASPDADEKPKSDDKPAAAAGNGADSSVEKEAASEKDAEKGGQTEAEQKADDKDDMNRPIEFPLSRMPDDPGPDEEEEDKSSKTPRPRFFN
ncbi:heme biosynthesis HemY N-terminal domain-containing protein [Roseibium sp. SCPC15]|uniref:heme biosynthesis HemY N-terminal domain-containing protein n=1 Tax=Roseibium sp. SCP15 TaxID=3141376 RepID=UPI0033392C09